MAQTLQVTQALTGRLSARLPWTPPKRKLAASNAEQVKKIVRILAELGLEPANPDEARGLQKQRVAIGFCYSAKAPPPPGPPTDLLHLERASARI